MGLDMAISDYIKVDLYGQYNNDTAHAYSYPERIKSQYDFTNAEWAASIADPRALFQSVCKSGPCYIIYRHKNGYYYSLVERNLADSRGGLEMVTIFAPTGQYAAGNSVLTALKDLRNILIRDRRYDDILVKNCVARINAGVQSSVFPRKGTQASATQPVAVFRTYKNESELIDLFSFLGQREYENVDKLLFVQENDVKDGATLQRLYAQIKKVYSIAYANDTSTDKNSVCVGDSFKISYSKVGYEPLTVEVKLEPLSNNRYFKIDGNKLQLIGPEALNLRFSKRLYIRIESEDRSRIETEKAEVVFDGKPAKRLPNGEICVYVLEDDIFAGSVATLSVNCPHYEPAQEKVPLDNLQNNSQFTVKLKPKTKEVPIEFRFDDMGHDILKLPVINVPMKETDSVLRSLRTEFNFYGYQVYQSPNGYQVNIPRKRQSTNHHEDVTQKKPSWVRILLLSLGAICISLLLLAGGYILRDAEVINFTRATSKENSAFVNEEEHGSAKEETGISKDSTSFRAGNGESSEVLSNNTPNETEE